MASTMYKTASKTRSDSYSPFSKNVVVLQFQKDLSADSKRWLLNKLTNEEDGTIRLQCDVVEGMNETAYHITADKLKLLQGADLLGIKKEERISNKDDLSVFSITEKQYIVLHEIMSIRFDWDDLQFKDLPEFYQDQAIFCKCKNENVLTYFPVHCEDTLKRFETIWIKGGFGEQPIDEIQGYFGDSVAIYFSFLGFYTNMLFGPAIVGLFFYFLSFFFTFNITCYFSLFNVIWCSIFAVLWKRKSTSLAYQWGTHNLSRFEKPRAEFKGDKIEEDPITHTMEATCNYKSKYYRFFFVSVPVTILFISTSLIFAVIFFTTEDYIRWINHPSDEYRSKALSFNYWVLIQLVTAVYFMGIYVLDVVYRKIAYSLNNWENHRLQSGYDNFLIAKLVAFNFFNFFHNLFYVAFYMKDFDLLKRNLATLLITWQIIQEIQESLLPYLRYKAKKMTSIESLEDKRKLGYQIKKDLIKPEYLSTLDDFLEIFFQFGYVTLFSAVYPIAGLFALLSNLVEIRMDAFKFCFVHKKPVPKKCEGIGTWILAFELLGIMAIITNCSLIALNDEVTEYFYYSWGFDGIHILITFVIIEHILLFINAAILYLVPETPHWVKIKIAERDYSAYRLLSEQARTSYSQRRTAKD